MAVPDQKPTPSVIVTIKTLNEVLNYLATRPYSEVAGLVNKVHAEVLPQTTQTKPVDVTPVTNNATQEAK